MLRSALCDDTSGYGTSGVRASTVLSRKALAPSRGARLHPRRTQRLDDQLSSFSVSSKHCTLHCTAPHRTASHHCIAPPLQPSGFDPRAADLYYQFGILDGQQRCVTAPRSSPHPHRHPSPSPSPPPSLSPSHPHATSHTPRHSPSSSTLTPSLTLTLTHNLTMVVHRRAIANAWCAPRFDCVDLTA
jgi:hypothetical protein